MNSSNMWHLLSNEETLSILETDMYRGLTPEEAGRRRRKYGANTVWKVKKTSAREIAAAVLFDLPSLLLVISAAAAAIFDKRIEAGAIVAVLILGALLRTAVYVRANRILEERTLARIPVTSVIRAGRIHLLPASDIVPGDIIFLEAGDTVPCDGRVITGDDSVVSERGITDNALPAHKFNTVISTEADSGEIPCEFRSNMLFAGSLVLSGSLRVAATACGPDTLISMKQGGITLEADAKFPIMEKLRRQSRSASLFLLAAVMLLTALSLFVGEGFTLTDVFLGTMAMAVAAMSEFVSTIAAIVFAVTVRDAADGKSSGGGEDGLRILFREPSKMEKIASPDALVFCGSNFFKSGRAELLAYRAKGRYVVTEAEDGGDPEELLSLALCAAAARTRSVSGQTEGARRSVSHRARQREILANLAADAYAKRAGHEPSAPYVMGEHRDSAVRGSMGLEISLCEREGVLWAVACGTVTEVLACCSSAEADAEEGGDAAVPFDDDLRRRVLNEAAVLEAGGARVLAVAKRISPYPQLNRLAVLTQMMTFVGFFAVSVEPEEEARTEVAALLASGTRPILFTETPEEDLYFCRRIGLFGKAAKVIPYSEWNAGRAKAFLEETDDPEHRADGLIVSFAALGDAYLGGAYAGAMTSLRGACEGGSVMAVGMEAWDAGALGRADLGMAVAKSRIRAVPESIARSAAAVIHPDPKKSEPGFGGLAGVAEAVRSSARALRNVAAAKFNMTASQSARLLLVLIAILSTLPGMPTLPLLSPVFLLIWGLILDFNAALVAAFRRDDDAGVPFGGSETGSPGFSASCVAAGLVWGVVLAVSSVLAARLLGLGPGEQLAFLSVSAALSELVFSAECAESGSLFRRRAIGGAELLYVVLTVIFCALVLFTEFGAVIVCGGAAADGAGTAVCGAKGLYAVLPAIIVLLLWEGVKLVIGAYRKREADLE